MTRILYLLPSAHPGGAERATMRMLAAHRHSRYERGVAFFSDGPLVAEARAMGIDTHLLTKPPRLRHPWSLHGAAAEVADLIRRGSYAIVHSCMSYTHVVGGLAAWMADVPAVMFQHGPVGSWTDRAVTLLRCDRILVASRFMAAEQQARSWRTREITVAPYAVDLHIDAAERASLRALVQERHGLTDDAVVLGILARFDPWKGLDFAVRALAPLLRQNSRLRLMIVGGQYRQFYPHYADLLRATARDEGLIDQVVFAGYQLDVRPYYARLDALLHTSIQPEPFGLTIVEAIAAGVPVIAADAGGPPEIIEDGVDGLLYRPADDAGLRDAVARLLNEAPLRARLSEAGLAKVAARYRPEVMMPALDAVYRQLCEPA